MLKLRRASRLAAALALVVSAACGQGGGQVTGGTAGGLGAPLPDACEVMAPADVQAVARGVSGSLSSTLEDAVGKDPGQCSYSLGGMPPRVISLSLRRLPTADQAASQQQAAEAGLRSFAGGAAVEEVPGLADGAFWVSGQIDQLHVRRGDTLLTFTVQLDKEPLRAARTLAEKAIARLAAGGRPAAPTAGPAASAAGSAPPAGGSPAKGSPPASSAPPASGSSPASGAPPASSGHPANGAGSRPPPGSGGT